MLHGKAYSGRVRGGVGVGAVQGIRDFPYLKLGIRDFKAKSGRDSGLKVCAGGGMPKITLGITGLLEILGRDHGVEKPYWGRSILADNFSNVTFISVNSGNTTM